MKQGIISAICIVLLYLAAFSLHTANAERRNTRVVMKNAYDQGFTTALSNVLMRAECQTNVSYQMVYELVKKELNQGK